MAVTPTRRSATSVKKAAASIDAPVWRSYLAIRSEESSTSGLAVLVKAKKRGKPAAGGKLLQLPTPPIAAGEPGAATTERVRKYWEQLTPAERQQVLFLDEPDLVKQLYKLNLSLLCVGLMQRHLKANARNAGSTATPAPNTVSEAQPTGPATAEITATSTEAVKPKSSNPTTRPLLSSSDDPTEKTYELLEAMEFMDIGTGILTVKNELVESTERLFSLVGDVLNGFLSSVHVLTDVQFQKLFVTESEVINTWEDYQRLIGMLVEQLILKSYVTYLEKKALQQMEELLLEESQIDNSRRSAPGSEKKAKKKAKKTKKKKPKSSSVDKTSVTKPTKAPSSHTDCSDFIDDLDDELDANDGDFSPTATKADAEIDYGFEEPEPEVCEDIGAKKSVISNLQGLALSGLNPNAAAFHPQQSNSPTQKSIMRKRKLDKYIIRVAAEDIEDSENPDMHFGQRCSIPDPDEQDTSDDDPDLARWTKQRRFEDDAHLEWQLQQVYASTSALFGWDFSQQRELPDAMPPGGLPWNDSTFWRTAPQDVVRYFSPGYGEPFGGQFMAPPAPPPSLYYFNPQPFPFYPAGPSFAAEGPLPHDAFAFSAVVSSPDFSSVPPPSSAAAEPMD